MLIDTSPRFLQVILTASISTPKFDCLMAIRANDPNCPTALFCAQDKLIELSLDDQDAIRGRIGNKDHAHWAERAIAAGYTRLNEQELRDFIGPIRNTTFAFFRIIRESTTEYYYMALSNMFFPLRPQIA